jgi:cation:H+ antiporter
MRAARIAILLAIVATFPALALRLLGAHLTPGLEAITYGTAILGAAFLLTWASEVAQMDIAQGLALAVLALIAVLPEYAVDLYFAWKAAHHPEYTAYATANMTGANRLLIGIAWPLIIFLYWWKSRQSELVLPRSRTVELAFLALATLYSFVIPFKGTISLLDMLVLVGLFCAYMWRISRAEVEEPELVGPAGVIAMLSPPVRRATVVVLFVFSAGCILGSAEPFAEALLHTGREFNISEFLLVQWLAPLASEAPEVVIACILTTKGDAQAGMGAMISSKVNQWTLLVGTLPLVYSISLGGVGALHLDERQVEEILLTAAQSAFAVAVLANMRLSTLEAFGLFALFIGQFFFPQKEIRYIFSVVYLILAAIMITRRWKDLPGFLRDGFIAPMRKEPETESPRRPADESAV